MVRPKHMSQVPDNRRFSDLRGFEDLYGYCSVCGRKSQLNKYALGKQYGTETYINSLKGKLRCASAQCGNVNGNVFGTVNQGR
jgi:hypothetical protein